MYSTLEMIHRSETKEQAKTFQMINLYSNFFLLGSKTDFLTIQHSISSTPLTAQKMRHRWTIIRYLFSAK